MYAIQSSYLLLLTCVHIFSYFTVKNAQWTTNASQWYWRNLFQPHHLYILLEMASEQLQRWWQIWSVNVNVIIAELSDIHVLLHLSWTSRFCIFTFLWILQLCCEHLQCQHWWKDGKLEIWSAKLLPNLYILGLLLNNGGRGVLICICTAPSSIDRSNGYELYFEIYFTWLN